MNENVEKRRIRAQGSREDGLLHRRFVRTYRGDRPVEPDSRFAAGAATDYRALVCIFLFGGNDSNNLIVPNDNAGYQNYANIRVESRPAAELPCCRLPRKRRSTCHVRPASESHRVARPFHSGQLAVLANVGTLAQPLTRTQYLARTTATLPVNLFSHSDQQ